MDYPKLLRVIYSVKTVHHAIVAERYTELYCKMHHDNCYQRKLRDYKDMIHQQWIKSQ